MAAATVNSALTNAGYTKVADGAVSGVVQHRGGGLVRIYVGTADPTVSGTSFLLIGSQNNLPNFFSWSGLTTGDQVWAMADSSNAVVATAKSG